MQYTEVTFEFSFEEEYQQDMFYQGLADLGFESFMDEKAYIQTALLDEAAVRQYAEEQQCQIISVTNCPDDNWNATWEAEHEMEELPLGVRIIPHCAFGAGHHQTTGMMIDELIALADEQPLGRVLDQGCGTGVLAITAAKLHAEHVVAVDIDDKSVTNTLENAALNEVTLDAHLASTVPAGSFHLILANIHRNILLGMMDDFAANILNGGHLFLSGFYAEDVAPLMEAAQQRGFTLLHHRQRDEWQLLHLVKEAH